MARCKDCVHYEACSAFSKIISSAREVEKGCEYFKDLTKYVEVVRCGECRFVDTDACPMSGTPGRVSASDFCSYGERRNNETEEPV